MTFSPVQRYRGLVKIGKIVLDLGSATKGIYDSLSGTRAVPAWTNAGAPTNAVTLAGFAQPGDLLVDTTNKTLYQNTNTSASPTWSQLTSIGGAGAYSGTFDGAVGSVTPAAGAFTYMSEGIAIALAAIGTNRGNSLALTHQQNVVATAASSAVGVTLPASAAVGVGGIVRIYNDGPSNSFHVYAAGSDTIDGTAGSTGVVLTNAFFCDYLLGSSGAFLSYRGGITRSA